MSDIDSPDDDGAELDPARKGEASANTLRAWDGEGKFEDIETENREIEEIGSIFLALEDGNLAPLAKRLRSGAPVPGILAHAIADAIEHDPDSPFHIYVRRRSRGALSGSEESALHERRMRVGVFVEQQIRSLGKGGYESAITAAVNRFGYSRTSVNADRKYVLDILKRNPGQWDFYESEWGTRDLWGED